MEEDYRDGLVEFVDGPLVGQVMEFPDVPPSEWNVVVTKPGGYVVFHYLLIPSIFYDADGALHGYEGIGETHWEVNGDEHSAWYLDAFLG